MKPLLYLVAIVICEGARLPRGISHHIPHFKAIYHGHGATSYQNVQIQNHGSVPIANNYEEHIDDHHHHSSDHLDHVVNNYVDHVHDHHLSDHLHNDALHEVQLVVEVPLEHHNAEHNILSTIAPYLEHDHHHQHHRHYYEYEEPESSAYYLYSHQHDNEYH